MRRWHFTEGNKSAEKRMQKHQKGWSRALAIVESGTGQTTKHESAAQAWQSLTGWKTNQHLLSWRTSHRQGCRRQQEEAVPYIQHHPFSTSVHTPETCGSLQPSNYLPLHPIWKAELQGAGRWAMPWLQLSWRTGSSLLCLIALGCFLPSSQPQGHQGSEQAMSSMVTSTPRAGSALSFWRSPDFPNRARQVRDRVAKIRTERITDLGS